MRANCSLQAVVEQARTDGSVSSTGRLNAVKDLFSPLRQRECLLLYSAQMTSGFGDWSGRLALSVVVFQRSNSALWAALVTAVSLLPWAGPGQMIATFADRFGRVGLMVWCDLVRAGLYLLLLITLPPPVVLVVAFLAGLLTPPFAAARSAAMVEVVDDDMYPKALKLWAATYQFEMIVGFALGGVIIAVAGVDAAIVLNALTFAGSALLLLPLRGTTASALHGEPRVGFAGLRDGMGVWRSDDHLWRSLVMVVTLGAFSVVPEALAVAFVAEANLPDAFVGLLVAAGAGWSLVVVTLLPDLEDPEELLASAAARGLRYGIASAVLFAVAGALAGSWWLFGAGGVSIVVVAAVAVVSYAIAGGLDAVAVPTNQVVGQRLPAEGRTAAMSVGMGAIHGAQALLIVVVGAAATLAPVAMVLCVSMAFAAVLAWWFMRGGDASTRAPARAGA